MLCVNSPGLARHSESNVVGRSEARVDDDQSHDDGVPEDHKVAVWFDQEVRLAGPVRALLPFFNTFSLVFVLLVLVLGLLLELNQVLLHVFSAVDQHTPTLHLVFL